LVDGSITEFFDIPLDDGLVFKPEAAAIAVRVRQMNNTWNEWTVPLAILVSGGQGIRTAPYTVVATMECSDLSSPGDFADEFNGGLNGPAAPLGEVGDAVVLEPWSHDARYFLGQFRSPHIGEVTGMQSVPIWDCIASITRGWQRPTALTATPAVMSIIRFPSGSFTVAPLPSEKTNGNLPPPRAIDSEITERLRYSFAFGPGTVSVTIFGAPSWESLDGSFSLIMVLPHNKKKC
jgi:hypothetical protein